MYVYVFVRTLGYARFINPDKVTQTAL